MMSTQAVRQTMRWAVVAALAALAASGVVWGSSAAASGGFSPIDRPARLVDSRPGATTVDGQQQGEGLRGAGSVTRVQVGGRAGLGAAPPVVVLNLTVTGSQGVGGYLTVWPCGATQPNASNLNFVAGQTIAGSVMARAPRCVCSPRRPPT